MSKHERDTIHKVVTFRVCVTRLLLYLNDQRKKDKGGCDKRKCSAEVGKLFHKLDGILDRRIVPQLVCGDSDDAGCLNGHGAGLGQCVPIVGWRLIAMKAVRKMS
jgi:hypothetical protein